MSNHIICFSPSGATLGQRILAVEDVFAADWELTQCFGADHESLSDWTKRVFQPGNNLLFIGAAGIAVRAIAPYVSAKQSDPAVVVMDEKANWCIPILSGHLGGANLLANKLAKRTGAQAQITTATDVRGVWAVDSWANREKLKVINPGKIKEISAGLLQGQTKKAVQRISHFREAAGGACFFRCSVLRYLCRNPQADRPGAGASLSDSCSADRRNRMPERCTAGTAGCAV